METSFSLPVLGDPRIISDSKKLLQLQAAATSGFGAGSQHWRLGQHWLRVWSSWSVVVWWCLHGQAPLGMAAAGQVKGSPFLLELLIIGKQSCPHPLILSNHDNCCGAVILSPGQPPLGSSQRGLRTAAFLESLLCVRWPVDCTLPHPEGWGICRGYSTVPCSVPGHP